MMPNRTTYTRAGLHRHARAIHRPRIEWLNPGWLCVIGGLALSIVGVASIATTEPGYAARQIAILCVALVVAAGATVPHYRLLSRFSIPLMLLVLVLLVFVLIPVVPEAIVRPRNGARRWINLGVTDFQPSELGKIAYIIALASYLRYRKNYRTLIGLMLPFVLTFVPMLLILVEPDLGTALLFLPTLFAMLTAAGAKLRHLVLIIVLGLAAAPAVYPVLAPHQKDRINALYYQIKGDTRFEKGIGFQGAQATTLVGAGRLVGVGREQAEDLVRYNRLPEEHNDMVFAVISCRWGAIGAVGTWALFLVCCAGGLLAGAQCKDPFGRLVAVGIVAMLFAQMAINTGMTIGLMPITGMTLPFVSYGGSSLVAVWLMIGLLLNIGMRRPQYMARESFQFGEEGTDE
jgi:cell division protein FtsW (lipid II flippase)